MTDTERFALFSGGHDSLVSTHKTLQQYPDTTVLHIDTGIGIPETQEYVKRVCDEYDWPLRIVSSEHDYEEIVRENGFPGPGVHIIMYSKLKERALRIIARETTTKPHFYTGVRRDESDRRFRYISETQEADQWIWHAPIHDYTQADVTDYIETHGLPRNPVKDLYHHSGECLCGAFGNRTEELVLLEAHYPAVADRIKALEKELQQDPSIDPVQSIWAHGEMEHPDLRGRLAELDDQQMMLCASCESGVTRNLEPDGGIMTTCQRCGNTWDYTGKKQPGTYSYVTCPDCGTTVKVGNTVEADDE